MTGKVETMMRRILTTAVALALTMTTFATAAGEVTFRYQFAPGKSEKFRLKIDTDVKMQGMTVSQLADMTVTVTCLSKKDESYAMKVTFDRVDATSKIGDSPQASPIAMAMVGKTVGFTVDSHGAVSDIGPGPGFDAWPSVQQVVEPALENWYEYLPGTPVPVGGTWKRENFREKSATGAELLRNEHFKFREMKKVKDHDVAVVEGDVASEIGGTSETPVGKYDLDGTGKGKFEFHFDPATGSVRYFKLNLATDVNMAPQAGGDALKTSFTNVIEREMIE